MLGGLDQAGGQDIQHHHAGARVAMMMRLLSLRLRGIVLAGGQVRIVMIAALRRLMTASHDLFMVMVGVVVVIRVMMIFQQDFAEQSVLVWQRASRNVLEAVDCTGGGGQSKNDHQRGAKRRAGATEFAV